MGKKRRRRESDAASDAADDAAPSTLSIKEPPCKKQKKIHNEPTGTPAEDIASLIPVNDPITTAPLTVKQQPDESPVATTIEPIEIPEDFRAIETANELESDNEIEEEPTFAETERTLSSSSQLIKRALAEIESPTWSADERQRLYAALRRHTKHAPLALLARAVKSKNAVQISRMLRALERLSKLYPVSQSRLPQAVETTDSELEIEQAQADNELKQEIEHYKLRRRLKVENDAVFLLVKWPALEKLQSYMLLPEEAGSELLAGTADASKSEGSEEISDTELLRELVTADDDTNNASNETQRYLDDSGKPIIVEDTPLPTPTCLTHIGAVRRYADHPCTDAFTGVLLQEHLFEWLRDVIHTAIDFAVERKKNTNYNPGPYESLCLTRDDVIMALRHHSIPIQGAEPVSKPPPAAKIAVDLEYVLQKHKTSWEQRAEEDMEEYRTSDLPQEDEATSNSSEHMSDDSSSTSASEVEEFEEEADEEQEELLQL